MNYFLELYENFHQTHGMQLNVTFDLVSESLTDLCHECIHSYHRVIGSLPQVSKKYHRDGHK